MVGNLVTLILATGSRTWADRVTLENTLVEQERLVGGSHDPRERAMALMHGDCPRGADRLARDAARRLGWMVLDRPANWDEHPKGLAGFVRNGEMVAEAADYMARGSRVVCLAFTMPCKPDCRAKVCRGWTHGADHCGQLAEEAGIPTTWIRGT